MRLVKFDEGLGARVGLLEGEEVVRDLGSYYHSMSAAIAAAHSQPKEVMEVATRARAIPVTSVTFLAPVDPEAQILCVAANYREHAEEAGLGRVPAQPVLFVKLWTALIGPDAAIQLGPLGAQLDYEGELVAVIGRKARRVPVGAALSYVGGYTVMNDVTARDLQWTQLGEHRIVDWYSSKCLEASTPVGPWIITTDEIPDPQALRVRTWVNGELRQDGDTELMVHSIAALVAYASERTVLRPGDLIATGTPRGVGGFGGRYLKDGDVVEVEVECVGRLTNYVRRSF